MKKHLIAAAVAAVVAAPAMAQVSISGYLETGYMNSKTDGAESTATLADSQFGTSRIQFAGTEDLGGGLKAGFRLETDISLNNTTVANRGTATTDTDGIGSNAKGFWSRGAEINLSGSFGMIRIGKFDHQGAENNDLNVVGNIALFSGASVEFGSDLAGTVAYRTPDIGGVTVEIAKSQKDQTTNVTGGSDIMSFGATGKLLGVDFRAGYGKRTQAAGDESVHGIAAAYDFGIAKASIGYQKKDNPGATADRDQMVVSVRAPLGRGLDLVAVYKDLGVDNTPNSDVKDTYIGLTKALSKRTNLLSYYLNRDNGGTTADSRTVWVGVGHSF